MAQKILVIDDDREQQDLLGKIVPAGVAVSRAFSLSEAENELLKSTFDLVLLDVHLPDGDGLQFYAKMKTLPYAKDIPVIFITASTSAPSEIMGFSLGAEDYICKPVDPPRLRARLATHLQRIEQNRVEELLLQRGDIRLNVSLQKATILRDGAEMVIPLTPVEFKLLFYFLRHEEHVLSRERLLNEIWGDASRVFDRTVDMHVSKLRKKIGESNFAISAVQGVGYRLAKAI